MASDASEFHIVDMDGADVVRQTPGLEKEEWSKEIARRRRAESQGELDEVSAVRDRLRCEPAASRKRNRMYRHAPEQVFLIIFSATRAQRTLQKSGAKR